MVCFPWLPPSFVQVTIFAERKGSRFSRQSAKPEHLDPILRDHDALSTSILVLQVDLISFGPLQSFRNSMVYSILNSCYILVTFTSMGFTMNWSQTERFRTLQIARLDIEEHYSQLAKRVPDTVQLNSALFSLQRETKRTHSTNPRLQTSCAMKRKELRSDSLVSKQAFGFLLPETHASSKFPAKLLTPNPLIHTFHQIPETHSTTKTYHTYISDFSFFKYCSCFHAHTEHTVDAVSRHKYFLTLNSTFLRCSLVPHPI